jgi:hypothetical protein
LPHNSDGDLLIISSGIFYVDTLLARQCAGPSDRQRTRPHVITGELHA